MNNYYINTNSTIWHSIFYNDISFKTAVCGFEFRKQCYVSNNRKKKSVRKTKKIWAQHDKTNKMHVHLAKIQIGLGIRPVWSEPSLSAWRKLRFLATHWADSEDSDQTGRMPGLIWVFVGCTCHFVGFVLRQLIFKYKVAISNRTSDEIAYRWDYDCGSSWISTPVFSLQSLETYGTFYIFVAVQSFASNDHWVINLYASETQNFENWAKRLIMRYFNGFLYSCEGNITCTSYQLHQPIMVPFVLESRKSIP